MKTIITLCLLATLGACATPRDPALDAYPSVQSLREKQAMREERARESVQRMQDEYNALTGNAH